MIKLLLDIPQLEVPDLVAVSGDNQKATLVKFARAILSALSTYPNCVVVNGYPAIDDRSNLVNLSQAILDIDREHLGLAANHHQRENISFTKVRIDQSKITDETGVTHYSRTNRPLTLHTDSSYSPKPHELVGFQCIVADNQGGESTVMHVDDILRQLDDEVIELLQEPVYPFGNGLYPILFGGEDDEHIRYYRTQIDKTIHQEALTLSDKYLAAIESLDTVLGSTNLWCQFPLQAGQILFAHNTKVLHGRTGFSPESDRRLDRVRLHVDSLSYRDIQGGERKDSTTLEQDSIKPQLLTQARKHLDLALELRHCHNFQDSFKHYQRAIELAPHNVEILYEFGDFLLSIGKFAIAEKFFRRCLAIAPDDYASKLALSSLIYEREDYNLAREILQEVADQHPYIFESKPESHKPNLLKIRSFENSKYTIIRKHDGSYKHLLQGGHFSIQDLIDYEQYNLMALNIFDSNIDELEKIPQFDLLLNTIACADRKRSSLLTAARFIDRHPNIPVINDPRQVLQTTRERNALRLNMIPGVSFPKTEKVAWKGNSIDGIIREILSLGFMFPVIVRQVGSQTGSTVALIDNLQALHTYFQESPINQDYYVIQYQDCRNQQHIFNKIRIFFIDGTLYPVANLFDDSWNIHSGDRYSLMKDTMWTQDAEKSFLKDPLNYLGRENWDRLDKIRDIIGLDFFGIDFTITLDGTLFIFELNAAMRHNFDHAGNFPYTKYYLEQISFAFNNMVQSRLKLKAA